MAYDVIVIGVGSMGAPTCYELAARGLKVLGLEQFAITHEHGSHSGQSRLIRKAYFEHPNYVPLLHAAYKGWDRVSQLSEEELIHKTGIAYYGKPDGPLLSGVRASAETYNLEIESRSFDRVSQFQIPEVYQHIYEPVGGFVRPEATIQAYSKLAKSHDAEILSNQQVLDWKTTKDGVVVQTVGGTYEADKLVITAGAFSSKLLPGLEASIKITRQLLAWMRPENPELYQLGEFPCWVIEEEGYPGIFYGFPIMPREWGGPIGLKLGHHRPGEVIDPKDKENFNGQEEEQHLMDMVERFFGGSDKIQKGIIKSCLYTYSTDEDFIIDFVPETHERVVAACGFSGHGFKFAPVVGEILADLTEKGHTTHPIEFLSLDRLRQH